MSDASEDAHLGSGTAPAPSLAERKPDTGDAHAPAADAQAGPDGPSQGRWPLAPRGHEQGGPGATRRAPGSPAGADHGATRPPDPADNTAAARPEHERQAGDSAGRSGVGDGARRLVSAERAGVYRRRFDSVKGEFVDDPRRAVQRVDRMVGEILDEVERELRNDHGELSKRLSDEHAGTEDLRQAFGGYRVMLDRLLSL